MEIQSAFNAGVQGFQTATEEASRAASDIARSTAVDAEASAEPVASNTSSPSSVTNEPNGLTESIVNLRVAEVQAQASAEVIQSADENLGTLIDVRV